MSSSESPGRRRLRHLRGSTMTGPALASHLHGVSKAHETGDVGDRDPARGEVASVITKYVRTL